LESSRVDVAGSFARGELIAIHPGMVLVNSALPQLGKMVTGNGSFRAEASKIPVEFLGAEIRSLSPHFRVGSVIPVIPFLYG
jgi:primosomal replication protein N